MTEVVIVVGGLVLLILALRTKPTRVGKRAGWIYGSQSD